MSVKTILFENQYGSSQTEDRWSDGLWGSCPWQQIQEKVIQGQTFEYNFTEAPTTPPTTEGAWSIFTAFTSTGGFINGHATGRGWTLGSDGDNEGASFRSKASPWKISRSNFKFWLEAIMETSTIADTKHGWFMGLTENTAFSATVPIAADGTLADINLVGFHRLEGDGDAVDTVYKANGVTQVTVGADATTIAAATRFKLGMFFENRADAFTADPSLAGSDKFNLFFYRDGLRLADKKQIPSAAGTDFPNDVNLGFCLAVLNATGSTPGDTTIRGVRIAQCYEQF